MGSNSGIERNWLVSVNGLNIYYSPESKTIKSMSNRYSLTNSFR
ncbi:hypothetical protein HMPREF1610_01315 [Escherichia coli 908555]|nr:hypothetical protein HMPREF1610_01315 [Escherichia coli 908555]